MYIKRRFYLSHVTKVSAQALSRTRNIKLGKTLHNNLNFLTEKTFTTLILSMNLITKFITMHFN